MSDGIWIAFGLSWLALALYLGLNAVADAIRFRRVQVNIGELPDFNVNQYIHEQQSAALDVPEEKK